MATKGYALIDAATDKIETSQIPIDTTFEAIFKSVQAGYAGQSGVLYLYSEQGATDYRAALNPNAAMTAHSSFYLPAAVPAGTYFMTMTNGGVMGFDTNSYVALTGNQSIDGTKTFTSFPVTPSALPDADYEVANKAYVDTFAAGMTPKDAVRLATTAALPACTYAGTPNFTLTGDAVGQLADIDSVTPAATNRILVKNQADGTQNGIYTVTTLGDGGTAFVLTRATDYDTTAEVATGTFCYVTAGTANAAYQFIQTATAPTLDTDDLVFGILYAPRAETLATVTTAGATTTNAITVGGVTNTKGVTESGIKNLVFGDSPYTVLAADRHIYGKNAAGAIVVNLPAATGSGRILTVSKRDNAEDSTVITADTGGTPDSINGEPTLALSSIYDSATLQDCAANEWSAVIKNLDVAQNTYRVSTSGVADFTSIKDCIDYINTLSTTEGIRIIVDGGTYNVPATVAINATMPIAIEGSGLGSTVFKAATGLTNTNMFELSSNCDFTGCGFDGTLAGWQAGTNASFIKVVASGLSCIFDFISMDTCKKGIEVVGNSDIIAINFIIANATTGIECNAAGAAGIDIETGNLDTCTTAIHLLQSSAGDTYLNNLRYINNTTSVLYVPATFVYTQFAMMNCQWDYVGTFTSGFDFTRTDGRDANIVFWGNVGEENKTPHAKVNLTGNTTVTAVATNTWTKATFVNTSSYTCKWTIANNRITYQPTYPKDVMMWLSGTVYVSQNGTRSIDIAVVKNGVFASPLGQQQVTTDQNGRKFNWSTNVYADDVTVGSYYEVWIRNATDGEDPVLADLNWLIDSR